MLVLPSIASLTIQVIIVGAGLGGLGAAIAILLAGHDVLVLESASEIAEVSPPFLLSSFILI
jgi:2-polyprenyl-6-methoxyphenol hydroxylase-like FAD-dependent oxidoreductase